MHPDRIEDLLIQLYGAEQAHQIIAELEPHLVDFERRLAVGTAFGPHPIDYRDAILITYADQVCQLGEAPLETLNRFAERYVRASFSGMHILPFFPSTSDDGFAVADYTEVDPALGSWEDITRLAGGYRLMVDAVINHTSRRHAWFTGFLAGEAQFADFYMTIPSGIDLSQVVRPRTTPLATEFASSRGSLPVWTTFSADQVDLDYHNPRVLLAVTGVVLEYVARGAQMIRLDAIAYLWKEPGTTCIHLPQTHLVIRFLRAVLNRVAPSVQLVTETNVPHRDNVSYFGQGDEAQFVYNFTLPPLVMHSLLSGYASALSRWAAGLSLPPGRVTFLNFLASHDGIGVNPVRGILAQSEIDDLIQGALAHGGLVSYKDNPEGDPSPYELNISYFDALSDPAAQEPLSTQVNRFMAAQSILLAFKGLPAVYVHSLLGSRSWHAGVEQTGRSRTINREKFLLADIAAELADPGSLRAQVYNRYTRLMRARRSHPAFDPYGDQSVLSAGEAVFALRRQNCAGGEALVCLTNVSARRQNVHPDEIGLSGEGRYFDLIERKEIRETDEGDIEMAPYETLWLTRSEGLD